jgi:hypothetical protein
MMATAYAAAALTRHEDGRLNHCTDSRKVTSGQAGHRATGIPNTLSFNLF